MGEVIATTSETREGNHTSAECQYKAITESSAGAMTSGARYYPQSAPVEVVRFSSVAPKGVERSGNSGALQQERSNRSRALQQERSDRSGALRQERSGTSGLLQERFKKKGKINNKTYGPLPGGP